MVVEISSTAFPLSVSTVLVPVALMVPNPVETKPSPLLVSMSSPPENAIEPGALPRLSTASPVPELMATAAVNEKDPVDEVLT